MSSASTLSAGEDSAPDASEKSSWSKGFRGVLKEGLRNGAAVVDDAPMKELTGLGDSNPPNPPVYSISVGTADVAT